MAKVIIPTPLRKYTENASAFETQKSAVRDVIFELIQKYPEVKLNLLDEKGQLRKFIKVFVGEQDINSLNNEDTSVGDETVISIIPAIAGGC